MRVAAVVVAGGRGERFGGLKQFSPLDGVTVAARSVRAARSVAQFVVLVVPDPYAGDGEGADVVVAGGATRTESVHVGLATLDEVDIVVVHDAARPWASEALFESVVAAVEAGADAAVPGLSITDTVKRVGVEGAVTVVQATEARDELVTVQTPQAFRYATLVSAHAVGRQATDDAALVELLGGRVVVVPGEVANIKITRPEDLRGAGAAGGGA